jgi:glutathione S-transferase
MIKLYEFAASGNCHKVRLMLSLIGLPYQSSLVKGSDGEHKSSDFLRMNPFGQVPVLLDDEVILRDSQAILIYLARQYGGEQWLPTGAAEMSRVATWLSTAANEVARGPNALRLHHKFGRQIDVSGAQEVTSQLFRILEIRLETQEWLALGHLTIADVAMYPYVALSPEGLVDLQPYPAIRLWLDRMQALPGYLGMPGMYESAAVINGPSTVSTT